MTKHIECQAISEAHLQIILREAEKEAQKRADATGTVSAQVWHNNFKLLVILIYATGLRVSEALALDSTTIQRMARGEELVIHIGKTQSARTILLTEKERALFQQLPPEFVSTLPPHGLSNINGKKLDKRTATRWHEPYFLSLHSDFVRQSTVHTEIVSRELHAVKRFTIANGLKTCIQRDVNACLNFKYLVHYWLENGRRPLEYCRN